MGVIRISVVRPVGDEKVWSIGTNGLDHPTPVLHRIFDMGVRESEVGADVDTEYLRGAGGLALTFVGIAPRSHLASEKSTTPRCIPGP